MIAFDSASTPGGVGAASLTFAHTTSGLNRLLLVGISIANSSDLVIGVTYNGVSMTLVSKTQEAAGGRWAYIYYLLAPALGTNNVIVSLSSTATLEAGSVSYTGVKQSGQPDVSGVKTTNTVTSQSLSLTTVTDNSWMVSYCQCRFNANPSAGTNVTKRADIGGGSAFGDSNGVITPAGAFSMTWTQGSSDEFNVVQAAFSPDTSSPSASVSPSASRSPSASLSPSSSSSSSLSPSASISPSSSISASVSPSSSSSRSTSPSSSLSPSASSSLSTSPSSSTSASNSPSPSMGYTGYTKGNAITLPTTDEDLQVAYSEQEVETVSGDDNLRVEQEGAMQYMLHEFKNFVGDHTACQIDTTFYSDLSAQTSPVVLQVYNHTLNVWETLDVNNRTHAQKDIHFFTIIRDVTPYKNPSKIISCRVYQLAI